MTEVELLLALYHNPRTRAVALEMADRMREASKPTTPQVNTNRKAKAA